MATQPVNEGGEAAAGERGGEGRGSRRQDGENGDRVRADGGGLSTAPRRASGRVRDLFRSKRCHLLMHGPFTAKGF